MKKTFAVILVASAQYLSGCSSCSERQIAEDKTETFTESKPYTIEVRRERSYFQAERIANRLSKMGLGGYIIQEDTGDGTWYRVVSGALADSAAVEAYIAKLDTIFDIQDVDVIDYAQLDSTARTPVVGDSIDERHRITANSPDVPRCVSDIISKFPDNDMFYLSSIGILLINDEGIKRSAGSAIDMPRGLSLSYLKTKEFQALASVIYVDNIYGDQVTLQVVKCKEAPKVAKASLMPAYTSQNEEAVHTCSEIADKILNTGDYDEETKVPFEYKAYQKLSGFVASFTSRDTKRSYFIFTDEAGEYIYMAQSTKNKDEEMYEFIGEIGKSEGLIMYDEFYNSFYTAAKEQDGKDVFIGYYMSKLQQSYARSKGYSAWAKKLVGHWQSSLIFNNEDKGCWMYTIFDLISDAKGQQVYNVLYRKGLDDDCLRTIYGTKGAAIRNFWGDLTELNFGYGRYIIALDPIGVYTERELINRAENLQLGNDSHYDSTSSTTAQP